MNKHDEESDIQIRDMYENINALLKERKIKWKELSVMIGMSPKTLSSMKSQNQIPGVLIVKKIADVLDVSMDELFRDPGKTQALYDLYWEIPRILKDPDIQRISCIQMKYIAHAIASGPDENIPFSRAEISRKEVREKFADSGILKD